MVLAHGARLRFRPGSRRRFPRFGASGRTTMRRVRARRVGMSECAAVIDGSGSTECPMATRRRSLRWICSCRCVNCSYDECVGLDQTIAVQGFVTDQPLLSNNRSPTKGSVPHFYTKGATSSFSIWDGGGDGGTGSLGFDGWLRGGGSAGPCLRAQGSSDQDETFVLCARGKVDRFQCLLRPGPAAAWVPAMN